MRAVADETVPQLVQMVFDSTNARASAEFWRQLLGLVYKKGHEAPPPGADDPAGRDWLNLRTPEGRACLAFQQVPELPRSSWPKSDVPQQMHLDLMVRSVEELDAVHHRALDLGAELLLNRADDPEEPLRVYADPDGHPFCVFVVS